MDVSTMDRMSARVAIQIIIDELTDLLDSREVKQLDAPIQAGLMTQLASLRDQLDQLADIQGYGDDSGMELKGSKPGDDHAESSKAPPKPDRLLLTCEICTEEVPMKKARTFECAPKPHVWCQDCIIKAFKTALTDPLQVPPRCCGAEVKGCFALLPNDVASQFIAKEEELATPNPTYCSNVKCGSFIRQRSIEDSVATCSGCRTKTCVFCKSNKHDGLCPEDPNTKLLLITAKAAKWRQCSHCKNLVELRYGCNHITCRCKHEFCYVCGKTWKTCKCSTVHENRLLEQPHHQGHNRVIEDLQQAVRAQQVAQVQNLNGANLHVRRDRDVWQTFPPYVQPPLAIFDDIARDPEELSFWAYVALYFLCVVATFVFLYR